MKKKVTKTCPKLEKFLLSNCQNLINFQSSFLESLKLLDLKDCKKLTNQALMNIGQNFPCLTDLNLANSPIIDDQGLKFIANGCLNLKKLNLNYCKAIGSDGIFALSIKLKQLSVLELQNHVNLSKEAVSSLAKHCPNLTALKMAGTKVPDSSLLELAEKCTLLEHLDLSRCKTISPTTLQKFADNCPELKFVGLADCLQITAQSIAYLVSKLSMLQSLDVTRLYKMK